MARFVMTTQTLTAIIHQEDEWYVAECPEVDTVSQGKTIEGAIANLKEANYTSNSFHKKPFIAL